MRRTDRLFEILQLFRGGHLLRGHEIAEKLEVSLRTVYRDIDTLVASGVPIEGERGVGYILREPIFLPPLTLTPVELRALHLGMEVLRQTADGDLASAAGVLLDKIGAVLPADRTMESHLRGISVYANQSAKGSRWLATLRAAVEERRIIEIDYLALDSRLSRRRIRPLQTEYWGPVWTCAAWCELRGDFRVFRVDRIQAAVATGDTFDPEPGRTYRDYLTGLSADRA